MKKLFLICVLLAMGSIASAQKNIGNKQKENIVFPELLVFSDEFETYFSSKNQIEQIVSDKTFLEGPVWVDALDGVLFTDIPENKIYFWNKTKGLSIWLEPSGFSNGLGLDENGNLLLMQGNHQSTTDTKRQIGKIVDPKFNKSITDFVTDYGGKKFNSPNDIALGRNGMLYFTDPTYGLTKGNADKEKELPFNGVFKFENGKAEVLIDTLKSPNGIGLSPDFKLLYVSDSETGRLHGYELDKAGEIIDSVNFFDVQEVWALCVPSNLHGWD